MPFFNLFFDLLTTAPGNLIYHLVLAFSITGALQGAVSQFRATGYPQAKRMVIGLSLLLTAQVLLFLVSGLAWQDVLNAEQILPSLDRAVILFSVVWIVWMWAVPEPARNWDATGTVLSLIALLGLGLGVISQANAIGDDFNISMQSLIWNVATLVILLVGGILLFRRRPLGFGNGMAMVVLIAIGFLLDAFWPSGGNYSGVTRLFIMAAFPLLLTLPNRFPTPTSGAANQTISVFQKNVADVASTDCASQFLRECR